MEFLLFLTPIGSEIYNLISQKIRVVENTPICKKYDIMGFYDSKTNVLTMCTDTIKNVDLPNMAYWINETLYHESVHVAQDCKANGNGWFEAFNINRKSMPLSNRRLEDLLASAKIWPNNVQIEHEAFWMEDKPNKVKYVVDKYCF